MKPEFSEDIDADLHDLLASRPVVEHQPHFWVELDHVLSAVEPKTPSSNDSRLALMVSFAAVVAMIGGFLLVNSAVEQRLESDSTATTIDDSSDVDDVTDLPITTGPSAETTVGAEETVPPDIVFSEPNVTISGDYLADSQDLPVLNDTLLGLRYPDGYEVALQNDTLEPGVAALEVVSADTTASLYVSLAATSNLELAVEERTGQSLAQQQLFVPLATENPGSQPGTAFITPDAVEGRAVEVTSVVDGESIQETIIFLDHPDHIIVIEIVDFEPDGPLEFQSFLDQVLLFDSVG